MTSIKCDPVQPEPLKNLEENMDKDGPHVELSKLKPDTPIRHAVHKSKVVAEDSDDDDNDVEKVTLPLAQEAQTEKLPMLMWWERVALIVLLIAVGPYLIILMISRTDNDSSSDVNPPTSMFTPPSKSDETRVFLERADADITMTLPQELVGERESNTVGLHMFWRLEQKTTESPLMLANHLVFGLPVEAPWYAPATMDTVEHKLKRLRAMAETLFDEDTDMSRPAYVTSCSFKNSDMNWQSEGLCFFFSIEEDEKRNERHLHDTRPKNSRRQHHLSASLWHVETKLAGLARHFQQPVVFKWWPHRWGKRHQHTVTVMQSLVPTREHLQWLKFHGPSRIRD